MARPTNGASRAPGLSTFQSLAVASQFGATLAVAVGVGLFAGQWLDGVFGTTIAFTLIGVFLGLVVAVTSTVRLYRLFLRRSEREWRERTAGSAQRRPPNDEYLEGRGRGPA